MSGIRLSGILNFKVLNSGFTSMGGNTMMPRDFKPVLIILFLFLAGCTKSATIISKKADFYTSQPKRIYLLTNVGSGFGTYFLKYFQTELTKTLNECGIMVKFSIMPTIKRDTDIVKGQAKQKKEMKDFNSDSFFTIKYAGGTRNRVDLFHAHYKLNLLDVKSDKTVWVADIDFYSPVYSDSRSARGKILANDVANKMKEDGILKNCNPVTSK